jgi:hypothetical protein
MSRRVSLWCGHKPVHQRCVRDPSTDNVTMPRETASPRQQCERREHFRRPIAEVMSAVWLTIPVAGPDGSVYLAVHTCAAR